MTAAEERANLDRIERDRRRRELLLLLLLLSFSDRALRQARAAVRVGADPVQAAADAIRGRGIATGQHVHWQGLGVRLLPLLAEAYAAGIVRAARLAGVTIDIPDEPEAPPSVRQAAQDMADKTALAVSRIVSGAVTEANQQCLNASKTVRLLGDTFDAAGFTHGRSDALEAGAEKTIVGVYGAGMFDSAEHKDMLGRVTGFKYVSVLDDRTTDICRAYDGVTLPASHPWWRTHFPANHWRCRAVVRPRFDQFTPTADPPYIPEPMAGFGLAPLSAFGSPVGR